MNCQVVYRLACVVVGSMFHKKKSFTGEDFCCLGKCNVRKNESHGGSAGIEKQS